MKKLVLLLGSFALIGCGASIADDSKAGGDREHGVISGYKQWPAQVSEIVELMPVQDPNARFGEGLQPFCKRAEALMLKLHGSDEMLLESDGQRIKVSSVEWLLDILFRPQLAMRMSTFRVDDFALLKEIGLAEEGPRIFYSYVDLEPYLQELGKRAGDIEKQVQEETRKNPDYKFPRNKSDPRALARKIIEYQGMVLSNDFSQGVTLDAHVKTADRELISTVSYWVKAMPVLAAALHQQEIPEHVQKLINEVSFRLGRGEGGIEWLPPYEANVVLDPGGQAEIVSGTAPKAFEIGCLQGVAVIFEDGSRVGVVNAGKVTKFRGANLHVKNLNKTQAVIKIRGREWMSAGKRLAEVTKGLDVKLWEKFAGDLRKLEELCAAADGKEREFADRLRDWKESLVRREGDWLKEMRLWERQAADETAPAAAPTSEP